MQPHVSSLERAFQIAKSGAAPSVADIIRSLKQEGYTVEALEGSSLRRQLVGLLKDAKARAARNPDHALSTALPVPSEP
jgi:hypothetical protein